MQAVMNALGRALLSQLHPRMLLLTVLPFLLSLLIWGLVLWIGLRPAVNWLSGWLSDLSLFGVAIDALDWLGMSAITTVLVPLIALWVLLPLMVLTALAFVGTMAMPAIVRHVSRSRYPALEARHGGSWWGSAWSGIWTFLVFALLWIVTLPLAMIPPFTFVIHPLLWGWLTYRVMAYDALAEHASEQERRELMRRHRWPLLLIGAVGGAMGAAPTLLWLGGALSFVLFPLLAGFSIWLYVLIFVFAGLWFAHYCLAALEDLRREPGKNSAAPIRIKDIN